MTTALWSIERDLVAVRYLDENILLPIAPRRLPKHLGCRAHSNRKQENGKLRQIGNTVQHIHCKIFVQHCQQGCRALVKKKARL